MPDVLTRCPQCLGLLKDRHQGCQGCDPTQAPKRAMMLINGRGYRFDGALLYYLVNDDPDDYRATLIAATHGWHPQDVYERLNGAGWPTTQDHICPNCKEADSGGLEWCDRCKDQFNLEGRGKW